MEPFSREEATAAISRVYNRMIEDGWMKPVPEGAQMKPTDLTDDAQTAILMLKKLFRGRGREFTDADYSAFVSIVLHTPEDF